MSLGENLQYLRAREGVTQDQLAERLDVSRQSVSKWESGTSFPEMDTLLKLCDMFHTDMDTLLRGSVEKSLSEDTAGYDRFMTLYAQKTAGGVSAVVGSVALWSLLSALGLSEMLGMAMMLLIIAVAAVIFIASGMEEEHFRKKHPVIPDFYTEKQKEQFHRRYIWYISGGVGAILLGVVLMVLAFTVLPEREPYESYVGAAFLLIVAGYSCKMEIFPLYTVGVDANFAAPAPASAFISTALVNAGFVAIMRIYLLYARCEGEVFDWARHVLILIGIVTLAVGAMFLRRTNNYKRFLSYSTIENMGIVAIGMGVGGAALWAAVFHVACHTLVKSSLFLQLGVVRQIYDSYRINRLGDYININRVGAVGILIGTVVLLAFPPSPLFISEIVVFREIVAAGDWWLIAAMLVLLCMVIYAVWSRALRLNYHPNQDELHLSHVDRRLSYSAMILLLGAIVLGLWQPEALSRAIDTITTL